MAENSPAARSPDYEHSVPFFWPLAPFVELGKEGAEMFERNLDFVNEEMKEKFELEPVWATPNEILLDLNTMRLGDFSGAAAQRRDGHSDAH